MQKSCWYSLYQRNTHRLEFWPKSGACLPVHECLWRPLGDVKAVMHPGKGQGSKGPQLSLRLAMWTLQGNVCMGQGVALGFIGGSWIDLTVTCATWIFGLRGFLTQSALHSISSLTSLSFHHGLPSSIINNPHLLQCQPIKALAVAHAAEAAQATDVLQPEEPTPAVAVPPAKRSTPPNPKSGLLAKPRQGLNSCQQVMIKLLSKQQVQWTVIWPTLRLLTPMMPTCQLLVLSPQLNHPQL